MSFMHVVCSQLGKAQRNPHVVVLEILIYQIQMCLYAYLTSILVILLRYCMCFNHLI